MLYSKIEAVKATGIAVITLDRHRRKGNIGYKKIGARVMFTDNDIAAFLDRCTVPAREWGVV
jgi:fructose-1,6-bisphosphatase/sedoheptulose 1,7-bisphosphatase-like protein